jgi:NADH-quinone oxidoreductase subunit L
MTYTVMVDRLAAVMMALISLVSLIIHVYSERYMVGDAGYVRFFALLGGLTFVLLSLVSSGNLFWLFVCWHLVTWLLATLLVCNPDSRAARDAGQKTFWVQSFGDAAFAVALLVLYGSYGTWDMTDLFARLQTAPAPLTVWPGLQWECDVPLVVTLLLVLSVMTKSAQFPFHFWLIGTIEAPTPVSALMHAGIVNAGGFLVNRLAPLFGLAPTTLHLMFRHRRHYGLDRRHGDAHADQREAPARLFHHGSDGVYGHGVRLGCLCPRRVPPLRAWPVQGHAVPQFRLRHS